MSKIYESEKDEARTTDLNFLPPAGHTTSLAASVLWAFSLTILDPGRGGDDVDVALSLAVGTRIPVGGIFGGSWAGGDEGSGCKISERVKKRWRSGEDTD